MAIEEKKVRQKARLFRPKVAGPILFVIGVLIQQNWDRIESVYLNVELHIKMQPEEQVDK